MSWLSRFSLRQRKLVMLITLAVLAVGAYAIPSLKQQLLPNLSLPVVAVSAVYPGASPEVIEEQIVKPIENAVKSTEGLDTMSSTSRQSVATIFMMYEFGTDTDARVSEIQQAVNRLSQIPDSVDPQVQTGSISDFPTVTLAASGGSSMQDLADRLERSVVPELRSIDGVNDVTVTGVREKIVQIVPDAAKMAARGLDAGAISGALSAAGKTVPSGSIAADGKNLSVQIGGPITSVKDVQDLWITPTAAPGAGAAAAAGPVRLSAIADVSLADSDATSLTRTNGKDSLGVAITLDHDGSATTVSNGVQDKLADLKKALGPGAELTVISDGGPPVASAVRSLVEEGLLGLIMAVLVIVVFLRSGRSTLVTAISIPLSLVVALIALKLFDYSLNMLTLGALTMAVGRVVDDSIVVLENIKRHLGYGEEKHTAIISAVKEVAGAVTSSTATTVAVFLPIAVVGGIIGELFRPFSITVAVAMIASLFVSLTIIPVLAYWFLKIPETGGDVEAFRAKVEEEERQGLLQRYYVPVIEWATSKRLLVLIIAAVIFIGTMLMSGLLKSSFIGGGDVASLRVTQTLPVGTDLATTNTAAQKVETVIKETEGIESYQVTVGEGSAGMFGGGAGNTAGFTAALAEDADADTVEDALDERLQALQGAGELSVGADDGIGASNTVDILVNAPDDATLKAGAEKIQTALEKLPELDKVTTDLAESAPQISIRANDVRAAKAGLSEVAIAQIVGQTIQGSTVSTVNVEGAETDVVIKSSTTKPTSVAEVENLRVPTATGLVKLGDIADVKEVAGSAERTRLDGERTITVSAAPVGDDLTKASSAVQKVLDETDPPEGATYTLGGVTADQGDAFGQLGLAMLAAILIVFLILVAVFGSIRQTLILLVSVPFAATGAILLLLITGTPLDVAAMIGMLMLIGIVVTNAIVLVDLINTYREQGMPLHEAVIEGGRRRLRPILMTALATIFALIPMALGVTGHAGFISKPLAIVVIGGLISSTLLTLVLIPTLYTMVEGRREAKHAKKKGAAVEPPAASDEGTSSELTPVG
ncbi:efflux RND transporter permease subunit [Actinocorallia aurea]